MTKATLPLVTVSCAVMFLCANPPVFQHAQPLSGQLRDGSLNIKWQIVLAMTLVSSTIVVPALWAVVVNKLCTFL